MMWLALRVSAVLWAIGAILCIPGARVLAVAIDDQGNIKVGARAYTAARIGSEDTDDNSSSAATETFPSSPAGHLRQHRYFVEAELDHNIIPLMQRGFGPLELLNQLPFKISRLKYHLTYRGEGEGIYDYGPREFRTADQFKRLPDPLIVRPENTPAQVKAEVIGAARRQLRRVATQRHRLFQAFGDVQVGNLFLRYGKQILSWGETDAFRLLDNINPLDNSFGGFLISLDERRVPLHMLRANYFIGDIGPVSELFIEGYAAWDRSWSMFPGIPQGSPWQLPNLGAPGVLLRTFAKRPAQSWDNTRGGAQMKFNAPVPVIGTATFGVAHYYTYFDNPALQIVTSTFPADNVLAFPQQLFEDNAAAHAFQTPKMVQVTGATSTFVVPAHLARRLYLGGEPVIRTEFAFFNDEPRYRQRELDPFFFNKIDRRLAGQRRFGDSVNFVLGVDMNQFIRWLNPQTSFFFSTQFFFKHLNGAAKRGPVRCSEFSGVFPSCAMVRDPNSPRQPLLDPATGQPALYYVEATSPLSDRDGFGTPITDGEVLPVPEESHPVTGQPMLVHHPVNQYLQTLFISTSYFSGQVIPSFTVFYDWAGSVVLIPSLTFSRDPFRFTVQYNYLDASRLRGASGTSLLRDRDNVLFQLEYVI